MSHMITVIIPAFNSELTLPKALDSIINQEFLPSSVIVVNDCSTDNTLSVALGFIDAFMAKRISYRTITNPRNRGPSYSRNIGIEASSTRWVAFLDADDYFLPGKLFVVNAYLEKLSDSTSFFLVDNVHMPRYFSHVSLSLANQCIDNGLAFTRINLWRCLLRNDIATSCVVFDKLISLRFNNSRKYSEDYELWLSCLASGIHVYKIPYFLTVYPKHPYLSSSGLSSSSLKMSVSEAQVLFEIARRHNPLVILFILPSILKAIRRFLLSVGLHAFHLANMSRQPLPIKKI
jgi:glycosyltransferase involved in cell wall biosynthesis